VSKRYDAADIEVLSGLEPVRRRPGMYTDTSRPNHLAHEVVDNSVDEALAGHCKKIEVTLHADGSVEVHDDGRGMPVDLHPKEKIPGIPVVCTVSACLSSMPCQKTSKSGSGVTRRNIT
jgi:topoisomerase-4 subunit B